jgi:hypothetical protein
MRRFLAGKVSVVEDGRMDGYYEEGEKYRNKRNYVPLVLTRNYVPLVLTDCSRSVLYLTWQS